MLKEICARNKPTDQIEVVEPPHSLTSPPYYGLPGWQPTEIEEVEPPHPLTWQSTQIEEVEPPHFLTWQPTQIEEVEPPHSLTSPAHTLTHSLTSRTRMTGPGIMDRVIALFSSGGGRHKKKHQLTTLEKKMLKEICPTEIEEVEPPYSLTWQPTQIEEVEPPHSLTSPLHTLTHSLTSRTRRTGSGIMDCPTDQIEVVEPPHSLTSPPYYGLPGWQPTEIEEVEPPHPLTWQSTQIEEVEPPHFLTWQPTQIEEVEPPHSLTSPAHTLTHSLTSRTRMTGPGIMDRVIALFSSGGGCHKKKHQLTTLEKKMLKEICPTDQIEEVEAPHYLTSPSHYGLPGWQPTEIEEVEPPHSLTWRTGPGIMDRVIALFSSGGGHHKKNHQPTTEEKKMLKEICARNKPTEIEEVEPPHFLTSPPSNPHSFPHIPY
uniref:Uncharacterized protein n=1 Tax=Fagus sylvatica TaxID=28930 RepID=A0A2N9H844_FAGSY